jgi:hypothetical protein
MLTGLIQNPKARSKINVPNLSISAYKHLPFLNATNSYSSTIKPWINPEKAGKSPT